MHICIRIYANRDMHIHTDMRTHIYIYIYIHIYMYTYACVCRRNAVGLGITPKGYGPDPAGGRAPPGLSEAGVEGIIMVWEPGEP